MINYTVKCHRGHVFDSWFDSIASFDELQAAKKLMCERCDSREITKAPMAPAIRRSGNSSGQTAAAREAFLRTVAKAENVGDDFAKEARAMHQGKVPERTIKGNATEDETRALVRDGIPIGRIPKYDA